MAESLKALSWNVNGIRAAHKKGFVDWLTQTDPDIMCLQETKAHLDQLPAALKEVEGYHSYFSTPERKGYSGVAIYTKTEPESVSVGLGVEEYDKEGRVLVADYGQFVVINIYFPNGQSSGERLQYKMEFYDHFLGPAQAQRGNIGLPAHRKRMDGQVHQPWLQRHLPHVQPRARELHLLGPDNPRPGAERWLEDRLLLRGRRFFVPGEKRLHPRRRDGVRPLPHRYRHRLI